MGKRLESAKETRKKIIDAMTLLLDEKKLDEISIEEITKNAGVAKGSFYTYFKRKEDIITAITLKDFECIKELINDSNLSCDEKVCLYLIKSAEMIEKDTVELAQLWMKGAVAPLQEETNAMNKYQFDYQTIQEILMNANFSNRVLVDQMTVIIMNHYYGLVATWCLHNGKFSLVEQMNQYCKIDLKVLMKYYGGQKDELCTVE